MLFLIIKVHCTSVPNVGFFQKTKKSGKKISETSVDFNIAAFSFPGMTNNVVH